MLNILFSSCHAVTRRRQLQVPVLEAARRRATQINVSDRVQYRSCADIKAEVLITSSSAIAERSRCRVRQLWLTVEDCNWETIFYGHYRSVFNHYDIIGQQSNRIRRKTQNKGHYAAQGHSRSSRSVSIKSPYATSN